MLALECSSLPPEARGGTLTVRNGYYTQEKPQLEDLNTCLAASCAPRLVPLVPVHALGHE